MSESCDLRHCLTLELGLALISLPWGASFLGPATNVFLIMLLLTDIKIPV